MKLYFLYVAAFAIGVGTGGALVGSKWEKATINHTGQYNQLTGEFEWRTCKQEESKNAAN